MHTVSVQILRLTDPQQPGWVECVLRDTASREWKFIEKAPVVSDALLDATTDFPRLGVIACEIVNQWTDESGRTRCVIDTERPWGIATENGQTQFEVFANQVTTRD
jgi:hypothetical protein